MSHAVLILDGDAAHTISIAKSLHESGYKVSILTDGKCNYGYHSRYVDERYLGPNSHEEEAYMKFLKQLLGEHRFCTLIPTSDASAIIISKYKEQLSELTSVVMPAFEVFMKAYDKNELMSLCREKGYPHPWTVDMSQCELDSEELKSFPYPAILKPNLTTGGRGMTMIPDYDTLLKVYPEIHSQYGECHLQRFIKPGGRQIKVQIFADEKSDLLYSSVIWKQRYYPVKGGSSCCNVTIEDPGIVQVCASVLKDINWSGFADFDLIEDPDTHELLIMEINPRIPACVRSAVESGMDYPTMIADTAIGRPLKSYEYKPGKALRHLGFDTLWFLKSPDRFKCHPNWFNFWGKNVYYQDFSKYDLSPFLFGTWGNIRKMMKPEFRKAKSGL